MIIHHNLYFDTILRQIIIFQYNNFTGEVQISLEFCKDWKSEASQEHDDKVHQETTGGLRGCQGRSSPLGVLRGKVHIAVILARISLSIRGVRLNTTEIYFSVETVSLGEFG